MAKALDRVLRGAHGLDADGLANAVAACAEGYAFPTNLDRDPPLGGLAPQSPQQLMRRALAEGWDEEKFGAALDQRTWSRLT